MSQVPPPPPGAPLPLPPLPPHGPQYGAPYGPPQQLNYAMPMPRAHTDLRTIAVRQRVVMYCILAYIVTAVGHFLVPPEVRLVVTLLMLAATITAAVFVFMLALAVYDTGTGILLGILTLVPLVGVIVLLVINGKA